MRSIAGVLVLAVACDAAVLIDDRAPAPDELPPTLIEPEPTDIPEEPVDPYAGAVILVRSPLAGEIYDVTQPVPFQADILSADGQILPFDEIVWSSSLDGPDVLDAAEGAVTLSAGQHTVVAQAWLPNNERLAFAIGGVRVQHPRTGVYAGNMSIDVITEVNGTSVTAACLGALDFEVDLEGREVSGGGACSVSLVVLGDIDIRYGFSGDLLDDQVFGNISVDLGFFSLPVGYEASFQPDGRLVGGFETPAIVVDLAADFSARRVSPFLDIP